MAAYDLLGPFLMMAADPRYAPFGLGKGRTHAGPDRLVDGQDFFPAKASPGGDATERNGQTGAVFSSLKTPNADLYPDR